MKAGQVVISMEPWAAAATEGVALGAAHFDEVDGGVEPNRPYRPDYELIRSAEKIGALRVFVARVDGRMVGYFTWTILFDTESKGLLTADQGAWFVAPGYPRVARALWDRAVAELKAIGVKLLIPHHRLQGRGKSLGRFFERRGAVKTKQVYSLWIGENQNA